jgi:hypothetical protein
MDPPSPFASHHSCPSSVPMSAATRVVFRCLGRRFDWDSLSFAAEERSPSYPNRGHAARNKLPSRSPGVPTRVHTEREDFPFEETRNSSSARSSRSRLRPGGRGRSLLPRPLFQGLQFGTLHPTSERRTLSKRSRVRGRVFGSRHRRRNSSRWSSLKVTRYIKAVPPTLSFLHCYLTVLLRSYLEPE